MSTSASPAAWARRVLFLLIFPCLFLVATGRPARAEAPGDKPAPAAARSTPQARLVSLESASVKAVKVLRTRALEAARKMGAAAAQPDDARKSAEAEQTKTVDACVDAMRAYLEGQRGACDAACVDASRAVCTTEPDVNKAAAALLPAAATTATAGGISWEAAAVTGLADFLSQRADRELVLWLSTEIADKLCAGDASSKGGSPRPRDLFPATCDIVGSGGSPAAPESGSLLAAAIRTDLQLFPARLMAHAARIDFEVLGALQATLLKMSEGVAPLEALAGLSRSADLQQRCTSGSGQTRSLACALRLVGLATQLAGDAVTGRYSAGHVRAFVLTLSDACGRTCGEATVDEEKASAFFAAVARFAATVKAQRDQSSGTAGERAAVMIAATLDVLDAGVAFFPDGTGPRKAWAAIAPALRATTSFLRGEHADGLVALAAVLKSLEGASDGKAWKDFVRLSSLVADIAAARDSKQVQSALEAAAAPVGSWRDKRRSPMLSATGLVGWSFGAEVPVDGGDGRRSQYAAAGPVGMVGLDLSFPVGTSTFGVFVSILDVGQLITLPLQTPAGKTAEGTTAAPEINREVRLSQVLSPGGYLKFGLGASPLVLGAGVSYAPDLRSYVVRDASTGGEAGRDFFSMWRVHAFLAVDVTLLPITRFGR